MLYTFSSLVRLPDFNLSRIDKIRNRQWMDITQEQCSDGSPTPRVRILQTFTVTNTFPYLGIWKSFFSEPHGVGRVEILEIGIKFSPASIIDPVTHEDLRGNINGLAILDPGGSTRYWIRSGAFGVGENEVGIFLSSGISTDGQPLSFESWCAFCDVAHRYSKLLRAQRKIEQLRGTRKNSQAFERLSAEIHELISESLTEV